jgi:hypothetical protein
MNVTMSLQEGVPVAALICSAWLQRESAKRMVLATFRKTPAGQRLGRAVLLSHGMLTGGQMPFDPESSAWLAGAITENGAGV